MAGYNGHNEDNDFMHRLRHSTAHVMAEAVLQLYPQAKLAIGPAIDAGFYYDFDLGKDEQGRPKTFAPEDLAEIEKRMRQSIAAKKPFNCREVSADEARQLFQGQPSLAEEGAEHHRVLVRQALAHGLHAPVVRPGRAVVDAEDNRRVSHINRQQHGSTYLLRGCMVSSPSSPNPFSLQREKGSKAQDAFKLMNVAGAYWRGDEHNPMLQRIYGTVWQNKKQLEAYLARLEEAKKRDHRKLGKDLEIFVFDEEVGPGLPLWLPRGGVLIEELERLAKEVEDRAGYVRVRSPHLAKEDLFLHSGHLPYYAESMYPAMELEGVRYYVKPMNCPFHHKIFAARPHSYRDLPLRLAEYGTCYRYEKSGELFGLMRVRSMQMNDAHIYCAEDQFEQEFMAVIDLYLHYFKLFDIEKYVMRFSTHHKRGLGKKYIDNERLWLKTEDMVRRAMTNGGIPFVEQADEAAFYGPKIDVQVWSAIGREFTLATNQVDFAQPARFDLRFTNREGQEETPLCIHRAPLSTHERMIGFLIEHYAGNFPAWLAPEQVRVIPITDAHNEYAYRLAERLSAAHVRVEVDAGQERMNAKIRSAQLLKVPYMAVVGEQEAQNNTVSLRKRDGSRQDGMAVDAFVALVQERVATRAKEL
ncbi:MAG: Threonine--tRNA ligase [Chloroflexi bacterium ADurb.Bin325]|nr:MAG: Threonine--tRNA ligase [Chloroflexi bacterium ADurb.Bin325]